jgi:hypothetical protein
MSEEWTIRTPLFAFGGGDIGKDPSAGRFATLSLGVNPVTGGIACNGYPGSLQMTRCIFDKSLTPVIPVVEDVLEVVHYLRVSRTDDSTRSSHISGASPRKPARMYTPSITIFQFKTLAVPHSSQPQHFLATVDVCRGEDTDPESSLKVWMWVNQPSEKSVPHFKMVMQV